MYEQFFGLKEKPFSLTPDTEYFYRYSGHQEALNVLLVALRNGEGFVRVIGEVGTGKTLLCRQLLKILQDDCSTVYLPNPLLNQRELYQAIASELGVEFSDGVTVQQLNQRIFERLIYLREQNRPVVIMLDEAQTMPWKGLEALRLLSNLETEKEKLLHVFFFAQPEFEQRLAQPELRQLRQRITFAYTLPTLKRQEVAGYLDHRLQVAGFQKSGLFQPAAIRLLHSASHGVPRIINLLAHKALLVAYGKGLQLVNKKMVKAAIKDSCIAQKGSISAEWPAFVSDLGAVIAIALVTLLLLKVLS